MNDTPVQRLHLRARRVPRSVDIVATGTTERSTHLKSRQMGVGGDGTRTRIFVSVLPPA